MNSSSNSSDSENPLPNRKIVIDSDTEIIPNIQARPSPVQSVQNDCERCKNLQYNAEHAWSVVRSATLKYSRNVELENENEQLNRINEEQAIYIEEQHNKIKELETTNNELSSANLNLEQRLEAMQSQYNMVVAKANEAKTHADAANEWRIKYESSQKTLLELHKSKKKTVDKYLAAVKLAKKLSENCDGSAKELSRMKEIVEPIEEELDEFRRTYKELFSYNKIFYKFLETRKNIERTQPVIKAIAGFLRIEETKKALLVSARRPRTRSRSLASCSMTPQENVNFDEISETGDVVDDGEEDLEETLERMLLENEQVPESINNSHEESYNISKEHIDADFIAPIISPKKHYSSKDQQNEPMSLIEKPISIDAANSQLQKHNTLSTNISVEEILNANFFKEMLQSPLISNIENTFQFSEISPESPLDTTKRKMLKSPLFPEPEPLISPLKKVNTERYKPVQDNDNSKDAQSPITESNLNSPTENYKTDTNQIKLKSILKSPISSQNEQRKTKSRVCIIDSDTNDEISEPQINENTVQRSDFLNKEHIEQDTRLFQLFQNASDKRRRLEGCINS
uniref:Uncharacterized protein n=1 Tax=Acrobeloides nanus TaxID=290746 RepID=A0A914DVN5_9BILA